MTLSIKYRILKWPSVSYAAQASDYMWGNIGSVMEKSSKAAACCIMDAQE